MQIIKLAAGRQIKIRRVIDYKTGTSHTEVIDNPNGEGCHGGGTSFNEQLLKDLLEAEVPGFGNEELIDNGLTEVGFRERMKGRTKPLPFSPLKGPSAPKPIPGSPMPQQPIPEGQLDTGFGV